MRLDQFGSARPSGPLRGAGVPIFLFAIAILSWPYMATLILPEGAEHGDHSVFDHFAVLVFNLAIALSASSLLQASHLRRVIADRERQRQRADRNARHDPLTGLPNRRAFEGELVLAQRNWQGTAPRVVAIADLDKFKPVNDIHGHSTGDATLIVVARRLSDLFDGVAFVARLGGDEFAILFGPGCDATRAERYTRRLLTSIEGAIDAGGVAVRIGCSIGLTLWRPGEGTPDVLRRADKALYAAKEDRGGFAWYDAELDRKSTERAMIEADLRAAIREGNVVPHFQPVFEIATRRLSGFEVLARWTHPTRGDIPPTVFVEIAEDTNLIAELGWSILRQACRRAAGWDNRLTIAVNISPVQFPDRALAEIISGILTETGMAPERLEIEITENAVIRDFQAARQAIDRLRELGIAIALDDFGTGYSSLASLRDLAFDRLKIDRTFVKDIAERPDNQRIVGVIMALASGFDLSVTAEGIESEADLAFMAGLNCRLGQGFWFDKPMPADMAEWMMETRWLAADPTAVQASDTTAAKAG